MVMHPDGHVTAPGGGRTTWAAVIRLLYRSRQGSAVIHDATDAVAHWNAQVGEYIPHSWTPTRITIFDALTGSELGRCELNNDEALLHAVLTAVDDRRR